ncbi:hypothetical protein ACQ4PT_020378 [Festuca glaucescens]
MGGPTTTLSPRVSLSHKTMRPRNPRQAPLQRPSHAAMLHRRASPTLRAAIASLDLLLCCVVLRHPYAWPPPPPTSSSAAAPYFAFPVCGHRLPRPPPPPPRCVLVGAHGEPPRVVAGSPDLLHVQPSEVAAAASLSSTPPKVPSAPGGGADVDMAAATRFGRPCYKGRKGLIQGRSGFATIVDRPCYRRWAALLRAAGGLATRGERSCYMGCRTLLPWVPGFAIKGVAGRATGGGCSCYKGREALRQQAPVCATCGGRLRCEQQAGVFSGDGFSSYDAFLLQAVGLVPAAEGAATRGVQRCYLGDDVFSGEFSGDDVFSGKFSGDDVFSGEHLV